MQDKRTLNNIYKKIDPWGFQTNPEDIKRKSIILEECEKFCFIFFGKNHFNNALELGAGEGWITKDLPALNVYGLELSDVAMSRWDKKIKIFDSSLKYDLIIAPGVLYRQYDYRNFLNIIREHSSGLVMTISIKDWEINDLKNNIYNLEFPYRQYTEKLSIFDATKGGL